MKVITIWEPWATLIALGLKGFETRGWATRYRGPLAIHASKKIDREACEREPIKSALAKYGFTADNLPTGAVVATSNLSECYSVKRDTLGGTVILHGKKRSFAWGYPWINEYHFGDYSNGRFAWELTDIKKLPEPIAAKGKQGLWNWEGEIT
jgi:hypothetical protein